MSWGRSMASPGFPSGNLLELLQSTALGSAISPQIPQLPAHLPNYLVASPSQTVGMEQTRSAVGAGMGFTGNLVPSALGTGSGLWGPPAPTEPGMLGCVK